MGGFGSGNHWHLHRPIKRRTVEETLILSIDSLRKSNAWKSKCGISIWKYANGKESSITWRMLECDTDAKLVLSYSSNGEAITERIMLEQRPQKFGSVRYFFHCPACGKRTLKLYGLRRFLCRTCQDLTYQSCQESGGAVQRMFVQQGFVRLYQGIFDGIKITPNTAQKLMAEDLQSEEGGATWRKLRKKMNAQVNTHKRR
jgi:hypothetical protein